MTSQEPFLQAWESTQFTAVWDLLKSRVQLLNVTSADVLIRLNVSGNVVLWHSCHCRLGSLPLSAARKGRSTLFNLFSLGAECLTTPERWGGGQRHWTCLYVWGYAGQAALCWLELKKGLCLAELSSEASWGSMTSIVCVLLCFYPMLHFELRLCFTGSVRCVAAAPRVGFPALIWSCRFASLLFHSLSHLLWCIEPSLVLCVLFNPFNSFDCWMLKDKRNK